MMKNTMSKSTSKLIAVVLVLSLIISIVPMFTYAENNSDDPFIMVSMGDSYSSGEGIPEFYGQNETLSKKVKNHDWLAHRSTKSWPGRLTVSGKDNDSNKMKNNRVLNKNTSTDDIQWYFTAVSGAETKHFGVDVLNYETYKFESVKQPKEYLKFYTTNALGTGIRSYSGTEYMDKQLDVFNYVDGEKVDYVTLTLGGNDVGFTDIVTTCAVNSSYLYWGESSKLEDTFDALWERISDYRYNIGKVYKAIHEKAPNATILVAGYPELLDYDGKGAVIQEHEAFLVNQNVKSFNRTLESLVGECRREGIDIYFIDVVEAFKSHQAYSSDAWINSIKFGPRGEDINDLSAASAYSMHPNDSGAAAYAKCVNAKIKELENEKKLGTLSGKICKASDRTTPIREANVYVIGPTLGKNYTPDYYGNYSTSIPEGEYMVTVTADGYIEFNAYATVEKGLTTYMETFLMVAGEEGDIGDASGTITNAMTGQGVGGVKLDVRAGWNNTDKGEILTTVTTNSLGQYIVTLPIGNYTLVASKDGFVSTTINTVVQKNMSTGRNGSITPIISGDKFRVVLTWGKDPEDLDSHVSGALSNGDQFHVYYGYESQYDGSVEVCNLDVDDTTSYGPETITLNTTSSEPYYYGVHKFWGEGSLASSNAQVNLYQGDHLVATFNVPTDQGEDDWWNVFAIKNGELIVKNTITSSPDTTY